MTTCAPAAGEQERLRDPQDVAEHVAATVRLGPPETVGAELEWLAVDRDCPASAPSLERVHRALSRLGPLPGGSVLTTEPGGQIELSSVPCAGAADAVAALTADVAAVRRALAADRVELRGLGADPVRPPVRLLDSPRYAVMESYFGSCGPGVAAAGRAMMCSTAAVQVSLDAGLPGSGRQSLDERWRRAHAVGPALVAAFACSPLLAGRRTGWRSTRQRVWGQLDPCRTAAPAPGMSAVDAVTAMALTARVLTVRDAAGVCRAAPRELTFDRWLADDALVGRRVTVADLDYHLSTLFPPVRLRGWLELRYLDALPDPLWQVAVAVATAVLDDDVAADAAREACEPVEGRWADAARAATADPALAEAAVGCLHAAAAALPRLGAPGLAVAVEHYADRYAARGRCPADDLLDALAAGCPTQDLLLDPQEVAA